MGMDREERRKRILERGSDRLALITGEIKNLEASSSSLSPRNPENGDSSTPQLMSHDNPTAQTSSRCAIDDGAKVAEHKIKNIIQTQQRTTTEILEPRQKHRRPNFFSSKKLNSSIQNSEGTRGFGALIIGFLVVLSYVDYPLTGMNIISSDSIIALKPLYALLLSDAAIVLAHMFVETSEEFESVISSGGDNWADAEKLLERGLVSYQAFRGVFIDCSVYIVVVVCGLSFL